MWLSSILFVLCDLRFLSRLILLRLMCLMDLATYASKEKNSRKRPTSSTNWLTMQGGTCSCAQGQPKNHRPSRTMQTQAKPRIRARGAICRPSRAMQTQPKPKIRARGLRRALPTSDKITSQVSKAILAAMASSARARASLSRSPKEPLTGESKTATLAFLIWTRHVTGLSELEFFERGGPVMMRGVRTCVCV
jgi:hypothetical protein